MLRRINHARNQLPHVLEKLRQDAGAAMLQKQPLDNKCLEGIEKLYNSIANANALQEMQVASESLDQILKELKAATKEKNRVEADALAKDAMKEIDVLNKMSKILAAGAEDDFRRNRLLNDAKGMQDTGKLLPPDVDAVFKGVPKAQQQLENHIEEILALNKDMLAAGSVSTQGEILENASAINKALKDLDASKNKADSPLFERNLKTANDRVAPQLKLVNSYADSLQELDQAKDIKSKATALQRAMDKATKDGEALKASYNPAKNMDKDLHEKKFADSLKKVQEANKQLAHACIDAPDDLFDALRGKIVGDEKQLRHAIQAGKPKDIALTAGTLKCDYQDSLFLADMMALDLDDDKLIADLLKSSNDLSIMLSNLLPVTKAYAKEPYPGKAEDEFDELLANMLKGLDHIGGITDNCAPEDLMVAQAKKINDTAKKFTSDIEKGQKVSADSKMKSEKKKVAKQLQLADQVARKADFNPVLQKKMLDGAQNLESLRKDLAKLADAAEKENFSEAALKKVKAKNTELQKQSTELAQLAQQIKQGKIDDEKRKAEEAEKMRLEQERLKAEAEARRLEMLKAMEKPLQVVEEIWEAATAVQEATLGLEEDDSTAGGLVGLARRLAKAMQELSALSKTGTKQQITDLGKKIANMINELQSLVEDASKGCRDPILCQEMRDYGHVAKNFSIQLKIVSGVKANMILESDPDAATALITCCRGMCSSVTELVKLSQIAKLKPMNASTRSLPKK